MVCAYIINRASVHVCVAAHTGLLYEFCLGNYAGSMDLHNLDSDTLSKRACWLSNEAVLAGTDV